MAFTKFTLRSLMGTGGKQVKFSQDSAVSFLSTLSRTFATGLKNITATIINIKTSASTTPIWIKTSKTKGTLTISALNSNGATVLDVTCIGN